MTFILRIFVHILVFIFVHMTTTVQFASLQTNSRKYFNCCFPAANAFLNFVSLFLCLEKSSSGDTLKLLIPSKALFAKVHESLFLAGVLSTCFWTMIGCNVSCSSFYFAWQLIKLKSCLSLKITFKSLSEATLHIEVNGFHITAWYFWLISEDHSLSGWCMVQLH